MNQPLPSDYIAPWEPAAKADIDALDIDVRDVRLHGPGTTTNPPPYKLSPLCGSTIEQDARENPDRLFNPRDPHYAIQRERPEHRTICFLKAEGHSMKEIAELMGLSPVTVSNVIRQPWAQQTIVKIIHEQGNDAVQTLLQGAASDAVMRLISEMDNELARPSERINAADKLLDRLYGKPNQPIEHRTGELSTLTDQQLEDIVRANGTSRETAPAPQER